jgi:hypothetical protein
VYTVSSPDVAEESVPDDADAAFPDASDDVPADVAEEAVPAVADAAAEAVPDAADDAAAEAVSDERTAHPPSMDAVMAAITAPAIIPAYFFFLIALTSFILQRATTVPSLFNSRRFSRHPASLTFSRSAVHKLP